MTAFLLLYLGGNGRRVDSESSYGCRQRWKHLPDCRPSSDYGSRYGRKNDPCGGIIPAGEKELELYLQIQSDVLPCVWEKKQVRAGEIRLIADGNEVDRFPAGVSCIRRVRVPEKWLRAELFGSYYGLEDCRIALTNPVYVE